MRLVCQLPDDSPLAPMLPELLMCLNYLGKRGGFLQMLERPYQAQALPKGRFIHLTAEQMQDFEVNGTLQMLDACGPSLTFQKADIYNEARIVLHKDRILRHIVIPYTQTRSSRSYSWYQRLDASQ